MEIISKCRPDTDTAEALVFREKGIEIGYICVEQKNRDALNIIGLELYYCGGLKDLSRKDRENCELLIRAAGSYGLNRELFAMESDRTELVELLCQFGFQQIDGKARINLHQLFKGCKN